MQNFAGFGNFLVNIIFSCAENFFLAQFLPFIYPLIHACLLVGASQAVQEGFNAHLHVMTMQSRKSSQTNRHSSRIAGKVIRGRENNETEKKHLLVVHRKLQLLGAFSHLSSSFFALNLRKYCDDETDEAKNDNAIKTGMGNVEDITSLFLHIEKHYKDMNTSQLDRVVILD